MNRIRLLPEQVANQIAAGEVVERPASVVKELVENSLDAQASRIHVEIGAAGRSLIRVTDDGWGMSRDDALLCLERHATSKISTAADLHRLGSFGFRGEAIPSIASVSRFTLTTREREPAVPSETATEIVINGGRILEVREVAAPQGTSIEVRSLFFNVPARRKFLRTDETERAHIQHGLTTVALAHPQTAFTLTLEGRIAWQFPALEIAQSPDGRHQALRQRLDALVGEDVAWVAVEAEALLESGRVAPAHPDEPGLEATPPSRVRVWGWIGAPGVSRATREGQHLFVNRRPVENRGLNAALVEGYHNVLMKGRFPLACLFLELDPEEVDVNIHPAKREIKFHRERGVRRIVADAVRDALYRWHKAQGTTPFPASAGPSFPTAPFHPPQTPHPAPTSESSATTAPAGSLAPPTTHQPEIAGLQVNRGPGWLANQDALRSEPAAPPAAGPVSPPDGETSEPSGGSVGPAGNDSDSGSREALGRAAGERRGTGGATGWIGPKKEEAAGAAPLSPEPEPGPGSQDGMSTGPSRGRTEEGPVALLSSPLRLVGVIGRLYVVLESDRGLVLLDQHAAHERVLYEQMLRRGQQGIDAPSQRLLLPETLELSVRDAAFLRENLAALSRLGVGLSEFGERTFLLDALPPFVKSTAPRRFAMELVDELRAAGAGVNSWRLGEAVVAKTVCRHAVKARDPLRGAELEALLEDLRRCDMPYTCPHGRPTLIEMSYRELERKFGRVV